jgi:hypothetical protein
LRLLVRAFLKMNSTIFLPGMEAEAYACAEKYLD